MSLEEHAAAFGWSGVLGVVTLETEQVDSTGESLWCGAAICLIVQRVGCNVAEKVG